MLGGTNVRLSAEPHPPTAATLWLDQRRWLQTLPVLIAFQSGVGRRSTNFQIRRLSSAEISWQLPVRMPPTQRTFPGAFRATAQMIKRRCKSSPSSKMEQVWSNDALFHEPTANFHSSIRTRGSLAVSGFPPFPAIFFACPLIEGVCPPTESSV